VLFGTLLVMSMARGPQVGARYVLDHQDPGTMPDRQRDQSRKNLDVRLEPVVDSAPFRP
jgi:hypothetical protein